MNDVRQKPCRYPASPVFDSTALGFAYKRRSLKTCSRTGQVVAKRTLVEKVVVGQESATIDIYFSDGSAFRFHNVWLYDACRDDKHTLATGERHLDASPLITRMPSECPISAVSISTDGAVIIVEWRTGQVNSSQFDAGFLRTYGDIVGKRLSQEVTPQSASLTNDCFDFLATEHRPPKGIKKETLWLWRNQGDDFEVPRLSLREIKDLCDEESLLKTIIDPGCVIVTDFPIDETAADGGLQGFAQRYLGGLQKHPLREIDHWVISTEQQEANSEILAKVDVRAASNSYDTSKQLCNHTDQVMYGTPGFMLCFLCAHGEGNNSIVDGFAVAYALQEREPEKFALLSKYGVDMGRRNVFYTRGDLYQNMQTPVLKTDADGNLMRITYHEIYRSPSTLPFEVFPKYWSALDTFYKMAHSEEFVKNVRLRKGEMLIMNNWRTMHGRAGLAGKERCIYGGTVTREAVYSQVRWLRQRQMSIPSNVEPALPLSHFSIYSQHTLGGL